MGQRLGAERFYDYFQQFGLLGKTGIDLPGEAATIMHKKENMGLVELATVSFGQSFQITPIQLVTTASSIINGGNRITPHFAIKAESRDGSLVREFTYPVRENVVSEETLSLIHILDNIYKIATEELGMVYANKDQVRMYNKTESEYVRQYEDIPER